MPAKKKADPIALPAADLIESVAPDELPEATRGVLGDDERKLAEAIIEAAHDGNAARGPEIAEKKDAASSAARMKRLLGAFWKHSGIVNPPIVKTSVVPKGDGFAWAIKITAEPTADAPAAADDDAPIE